MDKLKCKECKEYFKPRDVRVFTNGFWCKPCWAISNVKPLPIDINLELSWTEAIALCNYYDGDMGLTDIETMDDLVYNLKFLMVQALERIPGYDTIQEPDP